MSEKIVESIHRFASRVHGLRLRISERFPVTRLRDRKSDAFAGWGDAPGVYFFEQDGIVQYVGRALRRTGLRARVHTNCTSFGDPAWDRVIKDPTSVVRAVPLETIEWYWAASLETFLISELAPPFNKRDS
jgi:hypothetical protein